MSAGIFIATGLAFFLGLGIGAIFSAWPMLRRRDGKKANRSDNG